MPYIKPEQRRELETALLWPIYLLSTMPEEQQDGALNYCITTILHRRYKDSYFSYNRALGVLEAVKLELYRRKIAPYEDTKMIENGDVP